MKKLTISLVLVLSVIIMASCTSQKMDQKRTEKSIKKEVVQLQKEGWNVAPGSITMELQLKESYDLALEKDDNGFEKYIYSEATTVGETYDAAFFQATNLAKLALAGKIQTEVTTLIDNKQANSQLSQEQVTSLTENVAASKILVSQKLDHGITPITMYRELNNGHVEVRTVFYYNHEMAMDIMKQAIREDLEKKDDSQSKQLYEFLDDLWQKE